MGHRWYLHVARVFGDGFFFLLAGRLFTLSRGISCRWQSHADLTGLFLGCHCGGDRLSSTWEIHGPGFTKTRDSGGYYADFRVLFPAWRCANPVAFLFGDWARLWRGHELHGGALAWHRTVIFWFDHWRGRAIAFAVMGASLAGMMMPPLVTALVDQYGWRVGYTVFGASTFLSLFPVVYLFLVDRPGDIGEVRDGRQYVSRNQDEQVVIEEDHRVWTWQELLKSPAFWSIGLIFGSMVCVFTAVMLHLFGHLLDLGLKTSEAAIILSITATFGALGKPLVGWLSDRFGARFTIWLGLVSQIIALLLFTEAATFWSAALAAGIYGFGYSGMSPLRTFAISTSIGSQSYAVGAGVLRWVELPFVLVASPLAGFIYDATGSYQMAFLILSCIGLFLVA